MLRLLFMPWYALRDIPTRNYDKYRVAGGAISFPFKYNNVEYNYETTPITYLNYYNQSVADDITRYFGIYLGTSSSSKILYFLYYSGDNPYRMGFPCIIYQQSDNKPAGFKLLTLLKIKGKYKLKSITNNFNDLALRVGVTFPIKFSINNHNYKYLAIGNSNKFSGVVSSYDNTYKFICGFNEVPVYSDSTSISTPPDYEVWLANSGSSFTVDFGNNEQDIPDIIYNWFIQNFDKVYENTYTIKSSTGATLDTLTEAPPMTSATLSAVGNAKYLTLKGENDTNYTMEWTSETPQGKIFAGLATSKSGSIVIPVGETSTINLTESTDLYEVWQTYRPPTTTFEIKTYNYSGETSRADKTDYLTPISTISGVLRGEASLLNFNVLIQSDTVPNFNYCYIDKFKRYYYVTEPISVRQNLWEMTMQVDALMTYKDSLLKCEGYIDRNEYIQNKMIIDNNRAIMQGADFEEDTITNELFGSGTFALSGLRIGTKELP